jgi:hypothetical protein
MKRIILAMGGAAVLAALDAGIRRRSREAAPPKPLLVSESVVIERPPEEVFAYVTDPPNLPEWGVMWPRNPATDATCPHLSSEGSGRFFAHEHPHEVLPVHTYEGRNVLLTKDFRNRVQRHLSHLDTRPVEHRGKLPRRGLPHSPAYLRGREPQAKEPFSLLLGAEDG